APAAASCRARSQSPASPVSESQSHSHSAESDSLPPGTTVEASARQFFPRGPASAKYRSAAYCSAASAPPPAAAHRSSAACPPPAHPADYIAARATNLRSESDPPHRGHSSRAQLAAPSKRSRPQSKPRPSPPTPTAPAHHPPETIAHENQLRGSPRPPS